jgi:hypothetical protein
MRKYCDGEKIDLEILMDSLDRFYLYSAFKSSSIIDQCLVNMNILAPNIVAHQRPLPKIKLHGQYIQENNNKHTRGPNGYALYACPSSGMANLFRLVCQLKSGLLFSIL